MGMRAHDCWDMKSIVIGLSFFVCLVTIGRSQETNSATRSISAREARAHVHESATVKGKIAEVYRTERVVHLNFERAFPDQPFTAVIFANRTNLFPKIDDLKNKTVEVTGTITEYRNRPEIILTRTNQLRVLESAKGQTPEK
jgi:DNA/RNA endonuclease YhcR with UshA esterase domain